MHLRGIIATAALAALLAFLLAACGGGGDTTTTGATTVADGATLLQERCASCHTLDRVTSVRQTADWWANVVARMVDRGAELDDAEQAALAHYLADNFGL